MIHTVTIVLDEDVDHFEKTLKLHVVGNAVALAKALRDGRFTVFYEQQETITRNVPL